MSYSQIWFVLCTYDPHNSLSFSSKIGPLPSKYPLTSLMKDEPFHGLTFACNEHSIVGWTKWLAILALISDFVES